MADEKPIIVTLQMDRDAQDYFGALRTRYFPPAINYLDAHLTLFHNLPGAKEHRIVEGLARAAAATPAFAMRAVSVMKLGRGVAFRLESDELIALRQHLAKEFAADLVRQDRQAFRPHVTVQNKVSPAEAAGLHDHLMRGFAPFTVHAEGLQLWHYDGGPWIPRGAFAFLPPR